MVITMGENVVGNLDAPLKAEEAVEDYRIETVIFADKSKFKSRGRKLDGRNSLLLQSLEDAQLKFFDENDNVVNEVEPGKAYTTSDYMKMNNLSVGDEVTIKHGDVELTVTIAGKLKDALLGSVFMGNSRFLLSREDFARFSEDEELFRYYGGDICYIDTEDEKAVSKCLSEVEGVAFNKPVSVVKMCYVMDMIVAGILIVLSVCLIVVSFVVLKFTITFTLEEEFREIGVMKAIGIKDKRIRGIYLVKYLALAVIGAVIGFFGSVPFGDMLMKSVSENMVLGNGRGYLLNVISTVLVVGIIVSYAYRCTGKLKKYSPIDAIRSGQTGERYKKKSTYRIGRSKMEATSYLALNDVKSSPRRYITIILAFAICSLLVLIIVNTTETLKSDKLAYTFGKPSDAYYTDVNKCMECMQGEGHNSVDKVLADMEEKLSENDIPAIASVDVQFTCKVEFNGEIYKLACQQGINDKTTDYVYYEGDAPIYANEIAITEQISDMIDAHIGDTLKITIGGREDEYIITAYFQTMNQMGELIRMHEDVPTDMGDASSVMSFQFDFTDSPSQKVIDERVEIMKDIFGNDEVFNAAEYTADCVGVVDTMKAVELLLLGITLIVVVLVTILMERSFISDEKGEIAILKAIGFSDKGIIGWHIKRFTIVALIAVAIAVILSIPMTNLLITPIFSMMGLNKLSYEIDPIQICLIFPGIILAVTILSASVTACYTKKINCRDTASIE